MELPEESVADVIRRLRRAEGQVRGVVGMLERGEDCRAVLTQLTAATRALQQAGFRLLASGMVTCLAQPEGEGTSEAEELEKLFLKLA